MQEHMYSSAQQPDDAFASGAPEYYPVTYETGKRYQVHHSYIWLGPLTAVLAVIVGAVLFNMGAIISLYEILEEEGIAGTFTMVLVGVAGFVAIYAIITVSYVLSWRNIRYVFDETEFSLYSGIITKRRVHVPYSRVQSVNHHASLVQRLFGVCNVSIDTAGGAGNKAVRVPFVTLEHAERIRSDLFARKAATLENRLDQVVYIDPHVLMEQNGTMQAGLFDTQTQRTQAPLSPEEMALRHTQSHEQSNLLDEAAVQVSSWRGAFGGGIAGMESVQFERGLTNKELLLTATTSSGTEVAAVVLGVICIAIVAFSDFITQSYTAVLGIAITALIAVGTVIVGLVVGCVAVLLSYGNFRVRRRGSHIEVERGLLQRVFTGIDIDRVQTVVIRQSFVRRCMGYCEVSLGRINAGSEQAQQSNMNNGLNLTGLIVHPFLKVDQAEQFLRELLPEFAGMPGMTEVQPLPSVALRRGVVRACIWQNAMLLVALTYAVVQVSFHVLVQLLGGTPDLNEALRVLDRLGVLCYVFTVVYTVVAAFNAVLWKRGSGHALSQGYVAVRNDGLRTDFTVVPRGKVQSGYTRTNPFQRAADVVTLVVTTAAGAGHTSYKLWDITKSEGERWLAWLEPRSRA